MPPLSPEQWARLAAASLGRNQGPELFAAFGAPMATGVATETIIPRPMQISRPLESIIVKWSGRIVIATANYTAGVPEAPATLIERIRVNGTHVRWGAQTPVNLSGAVAFAWPRIFQYVGNDLVIGTTRSADPGQPFVQTTGLTTGAIGTYDVECFYEIPMAPFLGQSVSAKRAAIPFLWRPQDWRNDLTIAITTGDRTSLGTPAGGSVVTWSSFGSAGGTPLVEVFLNYSLLGDFRNSGNSALLVRSERTINPALVAVASQAYLTDLAKQRTSNVVLKTGIALTGTSPGVNVFASLSDRQLDATKIYADNKAIRDTADNMATKSYHSRAWNTIVPQGYFPLSFIDSLNPSTALAGDTVNGGARFGITTDVIAADANNQQRLIQEVIYGGPF